METRVLGRSAALEVSAIGLGCMGMSEFYGAGDEAESVSVIHRAFDLGITFLDTADIYGVGRNEQLVGRLFGDAGTKWCSPQNSGTFATNREISKESAASPSMSAPAAKQACAV